MAGELGTVLERIPHGTLRRPAQGWYLRLEDGQEIFLGDYSGLAEHKIEELKRELCSNGNGNHG